MKTAKKALLIALLSLMWLPAAQATNGWFIAEVVRTGAAKSGAVFVLLNDFAEPRTFTRKWSKLPDIVKKEMFATALTAIATNSRVSVNFDPDESLPEINAFYLMAD